MVEREKKAQYSQPKSKENKVGRVTLSDFKTLYSYSHQDSVVLVNEDIIDQLRRTLSPGTNHVNTINWSLTKEQTQQNGEKTVFLQMVLDQQNIHIQVNLDPDLAPFTKINSEWTIHLNVRYKTIKYLEDDWYKKNKDNILFFGNDFSDTTPKL